MSRVDDPAGRAAELAEKVVDTDAELTDEEARDLVAVVRADTTEQARERAVVALSSSGLFPPDPVSEAVGALADVASEGTDTARAHALMLLGLVLPADPTGEDGTLADLYEHRGAMFDLLDDAVEDIPDSGSLSPRSGLFTSLGRLASVHEDVEAELVARLDADDPAVRAGAVDALATGPGLPDGESAVADLLDDPDPDVREAAVWASAAGEDAGDVETDHVDRVAARLDDDAEPVRQAAQDVFAEFLDDDGVWERIHDDLTAGDTDRRAAAYGVLKHRMDVESASRGSGESLADAVADIFGWDPDVDLADERLATLTGPLVAAVEQPDPHFATDAAEMLGHLVVGFDDPKPHEAEIETAIDALEDTVAAPERPAALRAGAASALALALANVHDPAGFEDRILDGTVALLEVAQPPDSGEAGPEAPLSVRRGAADAVGTLVDTYEPLVKPFGSALVELLAADDPDLLVAALSAIEDARIHESSVAVVGFESVLECATHESPAVAAAALDVLDTGTVGSALALVAETLADQLDREDPDVLAGAAATLARAANADPDAVLPYVDDLAGVLTDDSIAVDPDSLETSAPAEAASALSNVTAAHPEATADIVDELRNGLASGSDTARRSAALVPELLDFASPTVDADTRHAVLEDLAHQAREGPDQVRETAMDVVRDVLGSVETRYRYADESEQPDTAPPAFLTVRGAIEAGLADDYGDVRWHAAGAAAEFAAMFPEASLTLSGAVLELLEDPDVGRHPKDEALEYVSAAADHDPSQFTDRVPVLDSYLTQDNESLRDSAADALASIAEEHAEAVEPAARHLRQCLDDEWARDSALEALSEMAFDVPSAVAPVGPVFVDALAPEKATTQDAEGFEAVDPGGDDGLADLESIVDDMSRVFLDIYAVRGIAGLSISEPEAVADAPERLVERIEEGARGELMSGDKEVANRHVRRFAMFGLANLARHFPEEMEDYRETFVAHADADESLLRGNALRGVAWTTTEDADGEFEQEFVDLLDADQPIFRRAGVVGLGQLGADEHLTAIKRLERTDETGVVEAAAASVVDYFEGSAEDISVDVDAGDDVGVFVPDDTDEKYSL